ncbi:MAG: hypothetical protein J1E84_01050 [Muribaculaceae bacterium]|nr:hypothetical protein [Muribaculaceae bacterium]
MAEIFSSRERRGLIALLIILAIIAGCILLSERQPTSKVDNRRDADTAVTILAPTPPDTTSSTRKQHKKTPGKHSTRKSDTPRPERRERSFLDEAVNKP